MPTLLESFSGTYVESMYFEKPILTSDLDFAKKFVVMEQFILILSTHRNSWMLLNL